MGLWKAAVLLIPALAVGCSALVSFVEPIQESGFLTCEDGMDNDQDGLVDCDDPSCQCNRCLEPIPSAPPSDELGQVCARDCECPDGEVCNQEAEVIDPSNGSLTQDGRCIALATAIPDGAFDISFVVQQETNEAGVGAQNVLGRVLFDGEDFRMTSALLTSTGFDFRGPLLAAEQAILLADVFPRAQPAANEDRLFTIRDNVLSVGSSQPQVLRALFGLLGIDVPGQGLPLGTRAVVLTSTLAYEPSDGVYWRGRYFGTLRPVAALDRARAGPCPSGRVYDPLSNRCTDIGTGDRFFFGCLVGPAWRPNSGRVAYGWVPPNLMWTRTSAAGGERECGTVREGDIYRLRMRTQDWMVEVLIPRQDIGAGLGLNVSGLSPRLWAVPRDVSQPSLFEANYSDELPYNFAGTLWIDLFSDRADGRIFGWMSL